MQAKLACLWRCDSLERHTYRQAKVEDRGGDVERREREPAGGERRRRKAVVELAVRAVKFKKERGRLPSISSTDAWEKRMAEGAAAFVRFKDEGRYE